MADFLATVGVVSLPLIPALIVLGAGTRAARGPAALPTITLLALIVYGAGVGMLWWLT